MSKSTLKANEIIAAIKNGDSIDSIKSRVSSNASEWHNYSAKAYNISLIEAKKQRKILSSQKHVSATSNEEIDKLIMLNETLSDYAILMPSLSTMTDLKEIGALATQLPKSESLIIKRVGQLSLHPRLRMLQKKGRLDQFKHFKNFSKMFDAAILCYYRTNFYSCYLTLIPIIEGVIIRWMGYTIGDTKPEFEEIRKFFQNSHQRQPCPGNILFHNVYTKACDKILNHHLYKPTDWGNSYANFNRHVASHLLNDDEFATKENCIRLFMLIDAMTEIFLYESRMSDPRFNVRNDEIEAEINTLGRVITDNFEKTPEQIILGTNVSDLIL